MDQHIKFDLTNTLSSNCLNGIAQNELNSLFPRLSFALMSVLTARKRKDIGFIDLPANDKLINRILKFAKSRSGLEDVLVLGIGGSALGFMALFEALCHPRHNLLSPEQRKGIPRIHVLDNVDPERIQAILSMINPKSTLVLVISKSGSTAETAAQFLAIYKFMSSHLAVEDSIKHFIAVTDTDPAKSILHDIALKTGIATFPIPQNVGGRFSVLSAVGLLPAALAGIDVKELCQGAIDANERNLSDKVIKNPALNLAGFHYLHYLAGRRIAVMMPYCDGLFRTADWFRQLWAESLGKVFNRKNEIINIGPTPIAALGATDQHSQVQLYMEGPNDKFYTFLLVDKFRNDLEIPKPMPKAIRSYGYLAGHTFGQLINFEARATIAALKTMGKPSMNIEMDRLNARNLGYLLQTLMTATAFAGELFDINAFDQPGVELGKRFTYSMMGRKGYESEAKALMAKPKMKLLI